MFKMGKKHSDKHSNSAPKAMLETAKTPVYEPQSSKHEQMANNTLIQAT